MRFSRSTLLVALAATLLGATPTGAASQPPFEALAGVPVSILSQLPPRLTSLLEAAEWEGDPMPLPANPTRELAEVVEAFSTDLGFHQDSQAEIAAAHLPKDVAGRLAQTLQALHSCARITSRMMTGGLVEQLIRGKLAVSAVESDAERLHACAVRVLFAASQLRGAVERRSSSSNDAIVIDIWPVLRVDTTPTDNDYVHDYVLIVDTGGNDLYDNNAGGNLIDVKRGPAGSPPPPTVGPAVGCQLVIPDLSAAECVPASALLIDTAGTDTYGLLKAPRPAPYDAGCTDDDVTPSVNPRIVTEGAGLAGVGVLIDTDGTDAYTGRTISQGAGHIGGIGVLIDRNSAGDSYVAARNSQGFSLIGSLGLLLDDNGSGGSGTGPDIFDFSVPSGGLRNDTTACDAGERFVQGAANLGGVGALIALSNQQVFSGPPQAHGYGAGGGVGILVDLFVGSEYVGGPGRTNTAFAVEAAPTPDLGVGVWIKFNGF